jgi:hypothetical protein
MKTFSLIAREAGVTAGGVDREMLPECGDQYVNE